MTERKKIFLDTEFTGLHKDTTLVSIGLIADTGETFYAEFTDYDQTQVDWWINENVIKNLVLGFEHTAPYSKLSDNTIEKFCVKGSEVLVSLCLKDWFKTFDVQMEVWSDCLAYDWVLFNELFNNSLPKNIYYIPFDICTYFKLKGIDPDIKREEYVEVSSIDNKHNALWDAKVIKACFEKLNTVVQIK